MNRPVKAMRGAVTKIWERFSTITCQSERTTLLGTILLLSVVSAATGYILTQYYSVDVLSSLVFIPEDCWLDASTRIGRHCFSDYSWVVRTGLQPNPWTYEVFLPWENHQAYRNIFPAAGMVPHLLFGLPAEWLGAPRLGLIGYLLALTIAVLSPAVWAARGARGLERVVVFVALGAAAIPAWMAIDRGNSAGFLAPIGLVFLVALRRRRWALVAITVVVAALLKPQFAVFAVALLAARQWRLAGLSVAGVVVSNIAAYLLWPRDFPETIAQTIHNFSYASSSFQTGSSFPELLTPQNVSFGRALLSIPDTIKLYQTGKIPDGFLAGPRSLVGYAVLVLVVVSVIGLGRRIPPVMVGILLLATAVLSPPLTIFYYLVFVLPVAALVVRDPDGPPGAGIFDQLATYGARRRAVGIWVTLATALSIIQVAVPSQPYPAPIFGQLGVAGVVGTRALVVTTLGLAPVLWLVACAVIIVSYARKPDHLHRSDQGPGSENRPVDAAGTSYTSELKMESSSQGPV